MKRNIIFLIFFLIGISPSAKAQMPTDDNPNFSNWDWENQSQENWQTKIGSTWIDIPAPFNPYTERAGLMVDVHAASDYTKAKGWQLVWAQFNNSGYPYFILYNPHKSIIRAFFYLSEIPFSQVLATLSFHDINNPGVLTFGEEYQTATDSYFNNTTISDDDLIAVVIPKIGVSSWGCADFPIMYDNNIRDIKYKDKKWVFTFYGCENYNIKIQGKASTDPEQLLLQNQHTIYGNKTAINGNKFAADYAKLHKEIQSVEKFLKDMQSSVKTIDTSSSRALQNYKKSVEGLKGTNDIVSAISSFSSAASAVIGFFKIISGSFNETETTKPAAVTEYLQLEGSMDIKYTLKAQTISIPGLSSSYYPTSLAWQPYNCPMGTINLQKTSNIKVTTPYEKYGYYNFNKSYIYQGGKMIAVCGINNFPCLLTGGSHPVVTTYNVKYPGKILKYKFDEDVVLCTQALEGLNLEDVKFAIICKPNGTGDRKYNISSKYLAYHNFWSYYDGREYDLPLTNPVYEALNDGRFIVHKFDEANNEVYFGTPFIPMNKFKGIVVEVPENTDVKLGILAKFKSNKYTTPIIFKAVYNLNPVVETAKMNQVFWTEQQSFLFSDYYNTPLIKLNDNPDTKQYTAGIIEIMPGFHGYPGFSAKAVEIFKGVGNTIINATDFNCNTSLKSMSTTALKNDHIEYKYQSGELSPVVLPNPTTGHFTINLQSLNEPIERIEIYNAKGVMQQIIANPNNSIVTINMGNASAGTYFVRIICKNSIYNKKIIKI